MKNFVAIIALVISSSLFGQDQWITVDTLKGPPISVAASCVLYTEGYVFGGLDDGGFRRKVYSYNYSQDDWDQKPSIGGLNGDGLDRGSACAFSVLNKAYVCLGQGDTNPFFKDLWEYSPSTGTWAQKADFAGTSRRQAACFYFDSVAFVGTGIDINGLTKDFYKYDGVTNTWTQVADFGGTPRKEAVGTRMAGYGYVGTGDDGTLKNDFWQYDPLLDQWQQKAAMPTVGRKGAVGWGIFPQVFICTGEDANFNYSDELWEYNYYGDTWVQRASLPGAGRTNAFSFVINNIGFVGSGYSGILEEDVYAYNRIVDVEELSQTEVKLFPNPATEYITVATELDNLEIDIFSIDGKSVTANMSIESNNSGFKIYRNKIPSGTYVIRLSDPITGRERTNKISIL